jgi:predicted chitinase
MINVILFSGQDMEEVLYDSYNGITNYNGEKYAEWLYSVAMAYRIDTPLRMAHWLAQVGHESGRLRYTEELASGRAYEGRKDLGNDRPGDGVKYKGRGLIQLTGKANHKRYSDYKDDPGIMENPETLSEVPYCVDSAGWFWVHGTRDNLNFLADRDRFELITRRINGGTNGIKDRWKLLEFCKDAIERYNTLALQILLNNAGRWPKLVEDGMMGPRTRSVLLEMQADYLMKVDGIVGPITAQKLKELIV